MLKVIILRAKLMTLMVASLNYNVYNVNLKQMYPAL